MSALLTPAVEAGILNRWPDLSDWCQQAEAEFTEWCTRNRATVVGVLPARYALVVDVAMPKGRVVYRASPDPEGAAQTSVSIALSKLGAGPRIFDSGEAAIGVWTVAERIMPGTPLGTVTDLANIDVAQVATVLRLLIDQPAPSTALPSIATWLRDRLESDEPTDLPPGQQPAPLSERQSALAQLDDLAMGGTSMALCHGDASPRNLLIGQAGRIWLIDPRGVTGTATYDVAVVALKAARLVEPRTVASVLATLTGVEIEHVLAWMDVASAARV